MIAVDTNVVIRLLTEDDPKQAAVARALFASESIWISKTVLLEANWVLRNLYGFDENAIRNAFSKLLGLKNTHTEDRSGMLAAIAMTNHGIDLADAIHLVSRPSEARFASFDRNLVRRATRAGVRR